MPCFTEYSNLRLDWSRHVGRAERAGVSAYDLDGAEELARRIAAFAENERLAADPPPTREKKPRGRRRPDPLADIFDTEVMPILETSPGIRPVGVFEVHSWNDAGYRIVNSALYSCHVREAQLGVRRNGWKERGMRAFAVAVALVIPGVVWQAGAEAAEARIDNYVFSCTTPEGKALKPKFGDIGGVFYTDLPYQREQCLEAIKNKIALCRENVDFESNRKNEEYAGCLPVFRQQAGSCVDHFISESHKCSGGALDSGKTSAGNTEKTAPRDGYKVSPLDKVMEVAKRANVRAGPGTDYDVVATLDAGIGVRVTGELEGGEWLRVDVLKDDSAAFVYAPLLRERGADAALKPFGPKWIVVKNLPCQVYNRYFRDKPGSITWSGGCADGKISGQGRLATNSGHTYKGSMRAGEPHGRGSLTWASGDSYEGEWGGGKPHGRGTYTSPKGYRYVGEWHDGKRHGRGIFTAPNGIYEGEFRNGKPHGYGTSTSAHGEVHQGQWRQGCFGERGRRWAAIATSAESCGFK